MSGYADITVPAGYIEGLPIGITFIGGRWAEPELLGLAYDFEQATEVRVPPQFIPTIGDDSVPRRPELAGSGAGAPAAGDPESARSRRALPVEAASRRQRSPAIRPGFVLLAACSALARASTVSSSEASIESGNLGTWGTQTVRRLEGRNMPRATGPHRPVYAHE